MSSNVPSALSVRGLSVEYSTATGRVPTVHEVSFEVYRGRILGVAGESGSGKTTAALAALGWISASQRRTAGRSELDDVNLFELHEKALRKVWGRHIGYVPQEVGGALHPMYRLGTQFREALRVNAGMSRTEADARAIQVLSAARIPNPTDALRRYPHQFSGGQLQRITIALALAPSPEILILDEPTTGLDVTTQSVVAKVLRNLVEQEGVAALFITHDIALLTELADDLVVMYAGEIVEYGSMADIVAMPKHPYTRSLIDAVPSTRRAIIPVGISGIPPGRVVLGQCAYADRCQYVVERCRIDAPLLTAITKDRWVRCWRAPNLSLPSGVGRARTLSADGDRREVIEVHNLTCVYGTGRQRTVAVENVSLTVSQGAVAGVVGESGSGKSTIGRAIAGILRPEHGEMLLDGKPLSTEPRRRTREQRRAIQIIFQNPSGSLNPRRTVGDHLNHIATKFIEGSPNGRREAILETLNAVQFSVDLMNRFPGQLSGGQQQRVAIAAAFIARPRLVICDEITSGQDVSVQAAILHTLAGLSAEHQTAVLFISHDLGVIRSVADHVYVMQYGRIVEEGRSESVFESPTHRYTKELLAAVPGISPVIPNHLNAR